MNGHGQGHGHGHGHGHGLGHGQLVINMKDFKMNKVSTQKNQQPLAISLMENNKNVIDEILPQGFDVKRLVRVMTSQIRQTPKLGTCDPYSFMHAVMTCAQLGLEPSKTMGRVHLIPYGTEVQCIIGYQGLIDLARRSGEILEIYAEAVYANDHFDYRLGLDKSLSHTPTFGEDRGEFIAAYAVAKYKNGGNHMVVMGKDEIEKIRTMKKYENKVWTEHYSEMAKKTAIRRLAKMLPMSVEIETAAQAMDAEASGETLDYKGDFQSIGLEVLDVETTQTGQNELNEMVDKIAAVLEKLSDKVVEAKTKRTKLQLIEACVNLEKAKTIFSIVSTLV